MFFILSSKQRTVLPASSEFAMFVLKGLIGSFPPLKGSRSFKIADLVRGRPWNKTGRQTYDKTCAVLSDTLETKLNVSRLSPSLPLPFSLDRSFSFPLVLRSLNPAARVDGGRRPEVSFSVDSGSLRSSVIGTESSCRAACVRSQERSWRCADQTCQVIVSGFNGTSLREPPPREIPRR